MTTRDVVIDAKSIDEALGKAKKLLALGVKTVTFQSGTRTLYPNDPGY